MVLKGGSVQETWAKRIEPSLQFGSIRLLHIYVPPGWYWIFENNKMERITNPEV